MPVPAPSQGSPSLRKSPRRIYPWQILPLAQTCPYCPWAISQMELQHKIRAAKNDVRVVAAITILSVYNEIASTAAGRAITSITVCKISVTSSSENTGNFSHEPVSMWIEQIAAADQDAASRLWAHFCQRLMVFARGRMSPSARRIYDEEDAALSAFRSLCRGIEAQRFPEVGDRGNLWALLVVITSRKIANRFRYEHQQRRDANQTLNESILQPSDGSGVGLLQSLPCREPTPAFAAEVADMSEYLMSQLPEPDLRKLVLLKLEGYTNEEVAEWMKITRRTVQRKLELIRRIWLESAELPNPDQT